MPERRWNPHVKDGCPACFAWGFLPGFKDPDTEFDCDQCGGSGVRRNEREKR